MTVYVHIGTGKTGTTTIQNFFAAHRAEAAAQGLLYPETLGKSNHILASVATADFHPGFTTRKEPSIHDEAGLAAFREALAARLAAELAASGAKDVLISNEHLFEKLRTPSQVRRFAELIGRPAEVRVILYVRRQDQFAASAFAEIVRMGYGGGLSRFLGQPRTRDLLDYRGSADAWAAVFGEKNVVVRVFERARLTAGDALRDIAGIVGADVDAMAAEDGGQAAMGSRREALDAYKTNFLRQLNRHVAAGVRGERAGLTEAKFTTAPHRRMLIEALESFPPRDKFCLPPEEAEAILERSREDNAAMFARFGVEPFSPPQDGLSGADIEDYVDVDDYFAYFARIWIDYHNEMLRLKRELDAARKALAREA